MSLTILDHTVLPDTRHKWTHPALTPAGQAGTRLATSHGGYVHTEMVTCLQTVTHPNSNRAQCRATTLTKSNDNALQKKPKTSSFQAGLGSNLAGLFFK